MDSARAIRPVIPSRAKLGAPARSRSTAASSSVRVVVVGASALTATGVLERYQPSDAPPRVFQKRVAPPPPKCRMLASKSDTQLSQSGAIMRAALKKERRNWILPEPLRAQPGLEAFSPVFRQILHGRGVVRKSQLDPWLQTDLERAPDPFLLKDMAVACDLIAQSIAAGERIAVYGDYDADGVTDCVTLARGLRSVGADVITYIPNRFTEGYGLNAEALHELHARGARLVITCDCGTNSVDVARGRPSGMRLIVTDHHEVGEERPPVDALINPKQADCPYPFDGLAACGVAYKLLVALEQRAFPGRLDPAQSLDAVALGTVADVVPLHGENRAIVRAGLQRLNQAPGAGCAALLAVAGISGPVTAGHLAF